MSTPYHPTVAQDRGSNIETSFEELRLDYYERRKSAEGQPIPITIMSTQNGFGTAAAVPEGNRIPII